MPINSSLISPFNDMKDPFTFNIGIEYSKRCFNDATALDVMISYCSRWSLAYSSALAFITLISFNSRVSITFCKNKHFLFVESNRSILILGTLLSAKSVGGISSLIVNAAAILGGMFMPLETMAKPFRIVCYSLPFASSLKFTYLIYLGDYQEALMYGLIVFAYMVVIIGLAILIFTKKLTKQK